MNGKTLNGEREKICMMLIIACNVQISVTIKFIGENYSRIRQGYAFCFFDNFYLLPIDGICSFVISYTKD